MPKDRQNAQIIGTIINDVELRHTAGGVPVMTLLVETKRNFTASDGQRHISTEVFTVVFWRELAELCARHLKRYERLMVDGYLKTSRWNDKESGLPREQIQVVAEEVVFMQ